MLKGANIRFYCLFDESHFSNICTDNGMYITQSTVLKKVRSSQPLIPVLNWVKHSFSLWVSLRFYGSRHLLVFYRVVFFLKKSAKFTRKKSRWSPFRGSRPKMSCKIDVHRNFAKFTRNHLCQRRFFNKVAGMRPAILLKKSLWHRFFPVNFVKFLRTPFFTDTSGCCICPFIVLLQDHT